MKILGCDYQVDELAREAGRLVIFLLAGCAWTMFLLMLVVD